MRKLLLLIILVLLTSASEANEQERLKQIINKMDSKLFEIGLNQCNFKVWKSIISEELEFYDDRTGLNTSFEKEVRAFKDKCSKPFSVTRKLISSDVHKLGNYGAFQTGKHNFYVDDTLVEQAQFAVIWHKKDNQWVVKRIVSYDHQNIASD